MWNCRFAKKTLLILFPSFTFISFFRGESRTLVGLDLDKFKDEEIDMIILMWWEIQACKNYWVLKLVSSTYP